MYAQENDAAIGFALRTDTARLQNKLFALSSPLYEGRAVGTEGNAAAARYLVNCMKENGLKPAADNTFFQHIPTYRIQSAEKNFRINNFNYQSDYTYGNSSSQPFSIMGSEVVFVGYGIYSASYNDFENMNITNKIVMIMEGGTPSSKFGVPFTKEKTNSYSSDYIRSCNPKAILMVRNGYNIYGNYATDRLVFGEIQTQASGIPEITINEMLANKLLSPLNKSIKQLQYEIERDGKASSAAITTQVAFNGNYIYTPLNEENNLIGIIEGDSLKDEYVILCAHYDSKGKSEGGAIYYGAESNASGVSAALEIARLAAEAKKDGCLKRSLVLLLTTAKENQLGGSNFYVNNPLFPLEKTVAAVSLDKLGFSEKENVNDVYIVSRETEKCLQQVREANQIALLDLKYKQGDEYEITLEDFDQYNFARKNIPSITITSNYYPENEENPQDSFKFIDTEKLKLRTQFAFLTVWNLLNK
jgi:hypothetical protein